jgi:hypothetical protein
MFDPDSGLAMTPDGPLSVPPQNVDLTQLEVQAWEAR